MLMCRDILWILLISYKDHIDALNVQITRQPRPFPTIEIKKEFNLEASPKDLVKQLESIEFNDIVVSK